MPAFGEGQGPAHGGPLVTKSLLFVTLPAAWSGTVTDKMPRISVFDETTGELLGVIPLPSNPHGNPMTFLHHGKQYIAVAVGGKGPHSQRVPAEIVVLSLP